MHTFAWAIDLNITVVPRESSSVIFARMLWLSMIQPT